MAVWPQVRGESQQPISQLCLPLFWPSQASDTPWACMSGHWLLLGSLLLAWWL